MVEINGTEPTESRSPFVLVTPKGHEAAVPVTMTHPKAERWETPSSIPGVPITMTTLTETGPGASPVVFHVPEPFTHPVQVRGNLLPARFTVPHGNGTVEFEIGLNATGRRIVVTRLHMVGDAEEGVTKGALVVPIATYRDAAIRLSTVRLNLYPPGYSGPGIGWDASEIIEAGTEGCVGAMEYIGDAPPEKVRQSSGRRPGRPPTSGVKLMSEENLELAATLWVECPENYADAAGTGPYRFLATHGLNYARSNLERLVAECRRRGTIPHTDRSKPTKKRKGGTR